jgi:hypothetical protein
MPGSSPEKPKVDEVETKVEGEVETKTPDVVASAESSPAETKGEDKGDMLAAVKAALKPEAEKTPDSGEQGSKPETTEAPAKEGEAEDDSGDLTEEELARLRPKTRKRIDNLLKDRSDRDTKIAEIEPKAAQFDKLVRFIDEADLTKDEVNKLFDVGKDLKQNPIRAYEVLRPIMDQLEQIVGVRLPEDLQNAVRLGQITEAHAQELSSARGRSTVTQQQLERRDRQDQTRQERDKFEGRVNEVSGKVSEWERSQEKSDPDWKLKQPRIKDRIDLEILRRRQNEPTYFPTAEEAISLSKKALEEVNAEFKKLAPARREIRPGHTDAAATRSTAQPKTALEAAKLAVAKMA